MDRSQRPSFKSLLIIPMSALLLVFLMTRPSIGRTNIPPLEYRHKEIRLHAVPPNPQTNFDVSLIPSDLGLKKLKQAMDLIYEKSPQLALSIENIKKKGQIYLVYNPNYPIQKQDLAGLRVALFLPFYFNQKSGQTKPPIPVIISRHGIKWPLEDLAAVLVHELAGHGSQYLRGQISRVRTRELECNAWLLQELAHQQFGLDKYSEKMIRFRQQLGGVGGRTGHCSGFLRFVKKEFPDKIGLYEQLNPNVPELLKLLDLYIENLEKSGVTQKSLRAKADYLEKELARLAKYGTPDELYSTGLYLLEGAGYNQDPKRGVSFIQKAAHRNHPRAQYHLSLLYNTGTGIVKDRDKAYFWLCIVSRNLGHGDLPTQKQIKKNLKQVGKYLTKKQRADIAGQAVSWTPMTPKK